MSRRGSCESAWNEHELLNSITALFVIFSGFLSFFSDHRASSLRLAGALLFLNGAFSFACHFGAPGELGFVACTLDGSSMLVPAAVLCVTMADIVLDATARTGIVPPGRIKRMFQLLAKGLFASVVSSILLLGMIGQHNRLPGSPIYYYATLAVMSLIAVCLGLFAIFYQRLLDDHPNVAYVKHFMVPMGIFASIGSTVFMGLVEGTCDKAAPVLSRIPGHAFFHVGFSYSSYILIQFEALLHDHVAVPRHAKGHHPTTMVILAPKQVDERWGHKLKRIALDFLFLLEIVDVHSHRGVAIDGAESPLLQQRPSMEALVVEAVA